MKKIVLDLDDYCDKHNCLKDLIDLKKYLPNLKVTLFTIPKRISKELLETVKFLDWIQLAIHGEYHDSNYEFARRTYDEAYGKIYTAFDPFFYIGGFKAPGWQISKETMKALKKLGFWVAVQYPDDRMNGHPDGKYQPAVIKGMKYYALNEEQEGYIKIHGHTWDVCGNGIKDIAEKLKKIPKETQFEFINNITKIC